jgi:CheY-like chemotaxis protein
MNPAKKYYRLTPEGESLWSRRESMRLPLDYRRILGLVEYDGHREVIGGQLAQFPAATVDGWLEEFETLRLIESAPLPDEKTLPELAELKSAPPIEMEDRERFEPEASFADVSLTRLGVYVNYERIAVRAPIRKPPRQTVALVVEDDPDQLALALLRLTAAGYPVKTANGVNELFSSLEESLPDAIFLDVMLGDGDGFEALTTLRRHPKCAHLPIIMVTSMTEPEDVAKGLALGCDGYITKPYAANTLEYVLRSILKQEITAAGGAAGKPLREVAN